MSVARDPVEGPSHHLEGALAAENRSPAPSEPCGCLEPWEHDAWVIDLRQQLIEEGHDGDRVDALVRDAVARYGSARVREFIPLFVERTVQRALQHE
jgi:hypothetical protein